MKTRFRHFLIFVIALLAAAGPLSVSAAGREPDDTYFAQQWYLQKIRAPEAWNTSLGFEGITVAIIDSGVDVAHPDLKENVWRNPGEVAGDGIDNDRNGYVDDVHGWDFVGEDADPRPDVSNGFSFLGANHGTIDAGVVAGRGNNGRGITGVTWQATIMPLRVLDSNGAGDPRSVVRAVEYAVKNGAKIVNLSFAGATYNDELAAALRRAYDQGVFVVAAAGNAPEGGEPVDLDKDPLYPVCFDRDAGENFVYGVAATDEKDKRASFSNYGAGCVDASAPGTRVLSTQFFVPGSKDFGQAYGGYFNGTSIAAAEVSGVVALLLALDHNLTPKQVMNVLTDSSVKIDAENPGYFGRLGRGRVDAAAAVEKVIALKKRPEPTALTETFVPPGARIVAAAPGPGRKPEVRLFTDDGSFVRSFMAFPEGFRGGVSLAIADFDGNARKTIVAGAMAGGAPQVRIFDINTRAIGGFYAYDERFKGGVSVAAGDLDGDGRDEIITGAGPGGGPHVRIFTPMGRFIGGFFPFPERSRTGVNVATGDLDGDGRAEIVTVVPRGSMVKVWDGKGAPLGTFSAGGQVRSLDAADLDGDGRDEIVLRVLGKRGAVTAAAYRADGAKVADLDKDSLVPAGVGPTKAAAFGSLQGVAPSVAVARAKGSVRFTPFEASFLGGISAIIAE